LYFATKEKLGIATERAFEAFSWPGSKKLNRVNVSKKSEKIKVEKRNFVNMASK
jgi:hypothetical protein